MSHSLADAPVTCPLCGQTHERCQFAAGSLFCAKDACRNPHHRPRPDDAGIPPHIPSEKG